MRPRQFGGGNLTLGSVLKDEFRILSESGDDRDFPGGNAGLVWRPAERRLPIATEIGMAKRSTPTMAAIIGDQTSTQRANSDVLQTRIKRGADLEAAVIKRLISVFLLQGTADFFDEVIHVGDDRAEWPVVSDQILGLSAVSLRAGDVAILPHLIEHVIAARHGG